MHGVPPGLEGDLLFFAISGMSVFAFIFFVFHRSTIRIRTGRYLGPTYWGHYQEAHHDCHESLKKIPRKINKPPVFVHEPSK